MSSFSPASRKSAKARLALCGPSGSGKTYTALSIATALGDKPAVIDTERGSASKYEGVNGWAFQTTAPSSFAPESLTRLLAEASAEAFDVVVIDSWSHYWMGADGMLEQVDRRSRNGNSFSGWKEVRPEERRMIDAIVSYPGHVIVTLRVKTEYVVEEDSRGKKVPRKVGLKPEQRDGMEYEFDVVGDLDHANTLTVSKTRIPALSQAIIPEPGEGLAATIREWLSVGEDAPDALAFREQILASDLGGLVAVMGQATRAGLGHAAVTDPTGAPTTLVDLGRARWAELEQAAKEEAS